MKTNKKKAFLMYLDSLEPISLLDDGQAGRLLRAIVAYQSEDDVALERLKEEQIVGVVFSRIEKYFEENEEKYERICRVRRESGKKGGLVKASRDIKQKVASAKQKVASAKQKVASAKQKVAKRSMIDDNDNEELSTIVSNSEKENLSLDEKDERKQLSFNLISEEFLNFQKWLKDNCPFVLKVKAQMSEKEYNKLARKYSKKELCDALESLNNWKDFPKKRTSVYRSTLDELKLKFGDRI